MSKAPAFQFYPADFLADENVKLMTNQEIGCYWKLSCYCWIEGSIPSDLRKMAKLCEEDGSAMAQLWQAICKCFVPHPTEPERLVHPRLEKEREKQELNRRERSESGKKGAKSLWNKKLSSDGSAMPPAMAQPYQEPMALDGSSSSSSSSSSSYNTEAAPLCHGSAMTAVMAQPPSKVRQFTDLWVSKFKETFKTDYKFDGAKDQKAAKGLVAIDEPTVLMEIAQKAWAQREDFNCKHSVSIAGFASRFNHIRSDLGLLVAAGPNRKEIGGW